MIAFFEASLYNFLLWFRRSLNGRASFLHGGYGNTPRRIFDTADFGKIPAG